MSNKKASFKIYIPTILLVFSLLGCAISQITPPIPTPTATLTAIPTASPTVAPTATLTLVPTQVELGQRYTETTGGFSYIPPTGWVIVEFPGSTYKIAHGAAANNFAPNINFVDEAYNGSLDSYVDASVSSLTQTFPDATILGLEELTTDNGQRCLKVSIDNTQSGIKLLQVSYFFDAGAKKIVAIYSRLAESGQENDVLVDQSMKSFRVEQ